MFFYDLLYAILLVSLAIGVIIIVFILFIYLCKEGYFNNYRWYISITTIIDKLTSEQNKNLISLVKPFLLNNGNISKNENLINNIDKVVISVNNKKYKILLNMPEFNKIINYRVELELRDGRKADLDLLPGYTSDIKATDFKDGVTFKLYKGVKLINSSISLKDLYN